MVKTLVAGIRGRQRSQQDSQDSDGERETNRDTWRRAEAEMDHSEDSAADRDGEK